MIHQLNQMQNITRKKTAVGNRKTNSNSQEGAVSVNEPKEVPVVEKFNRDAATRIFPTYSVIAVGTIEGIATGSGVENRVDKVSGVHIGEASVLQAKSIGVQHATSGYSECCVHHGEIVETSKEKANPVSVNDSKATPRTGEASEECEVEKQNEAAGVQPVDLSPDSIEEQPLNATSVHEFARVTGIGKIVIVEQVQDTYVPTCGATVGCPGEKVVEETLTSHGGLRKFLNVKETPLKFDADGGSTGGVVPKRVDPKGTTDVRNQLDDKPVERRPQRLRVSS